MPFRLVPGRALELLDADRGVIAASAGELPDGRPAAVHGRARVVKVGPALARRAWYLGEQFGRHDTRGTLIVFRDPHDRRCYAQRQPPPQHRR